MLCGIRRVRRRRPGWTRPVGMAPRARRGSRAISTPRCASRSPRPESRVRSGSSGRSSVRMGSGASAGRAARCPRRARSARRTTGARPGWRATSRRRGRSASRRSRRVVRARTIRSARPGSTAGRRARARRRSRWASRARTATSAGTGRACRTRWARSRASPKPGKGATCLFDCAAGLVCHGQPLPHVCGKEVCFAVFPLMVGGSRRGARPHPPAPLPLLPLGEGRRDGSFRQAGLGGRLGTWGRGARARGPSGA